MAAALDRAVFFDRLRAKPFGGQLKPSQVAGLTTILNACPAGLPLEHLGYCLATPFWETDRTMQPIEEYGRGKGKSYGPTGFWGRGLVQLTWLTNYQKATTELQARGILNANQSLVTAPALAMRPDIAAAILFAGMSEGWFTGKKLSDYFRTGLSDPKGARRIINGTDKAAVIAGFHADFVEALVAARYAPAGATPVAAIGAAPQSGFWARVHAALSRKKAA